MNETVLVTGGAGFVGSHVADAYVAAGYDVTVLDDLSRGRRANVPSNAEFVLADVRSREARRLVETRRFAIVNHHAGQADVRRSLNNPQEDANVNLSGLLNILEAVRAANVKRLIFASSGGAIYKEGSPLPVDETAPKLPMSPYGVAKLASEFYLAAFALCEGIEAIALRYSNVYGPRQDPEGEGGVVAVFARKAMRGQPIVIYGDGKQTRDMVYVKDVAAANLVASRVPIPKLADVDSRAYNIGTGVETSIIELAHLIQRAAGRGSPIHHEKQRPGEIRRSAIAPQKARTDLGWQAATSLIEGLRRTLAWHEEVENWSPV